MPIPSAHRSQLAETLQEKERITAVFEFLENERFIRLLDRFHYDPAARREAAVDGFGYLERNGVLLPAGAIAKLRDNNWCLAIGIPVTVFGVRHFVGFHDDSTTGFGLGDCPKHAA